MESWKNSAEANRPVVSYGVDLRSRRDSEGPKMALQSDSETRQPSTVGDDLSLVYGIHSSVLSAARKLRNIWASFLLLSNLNCTNFDESDVEC